jgi:hypothetical protein
MIDLSLLTKVAINLSKRDCTIRLRKTAIKEISGLCMSHKNGHVIDLDPDLTPERRYWFFLHEVAHAKSQPTNKYHNDWVDKEPGYFRLVTKDLSYPVIEEEAAANKQAEDWNAWAATWAHLYSGATPEERKLKALLNWAPNVKSFTEMIDDAAQAAAAAIKILRR